MRHYKYEILFILSNIKCELDNLATYSPANIKEALTLLKTIDSLAIIIKNIDSMNLPEQDMGEINNILKTLLNSYFPLILKKDFNENDKFVLERLDADLTNFPKIIKDSDIKILLNNIAFMKCKSIHSNFKTLLNDRCFLALDSYSSEVMNYIKDIYTEEELEQLVQLASNNKDLTSTENLINNVMQLSTISDNIRNILTPIVNNEEIRMKYAFSQNGAQFVKIFFSDNIEDFLVKKIKLFHENGSNLYINKNRIPDNLNWYAFLNNFSDFITERKIYLEIQGYCDSYLQEASILEVKSFIAKRYADDTKQIFLSKKHKNILLARMNNTTEEEFAKLKCYLSENELKTLSKKLVDSNLTTDKVINILQKFHMVHPDDKDRVKNALKFNTKSFYDLFYQGIKLSGEASQFLLENMNVDLFKLTDMARYCFISIIQNISTIQMSNKTIDILERYFSSFLFVLNPNSVKTNLFEKQKKEDIQSYLSILLKESRIRVSMSDFENILWNVKKYCGVLSEHMERFIIFVKIRFIDEDLSNSSLIKETFSKDIFKEYISYHNVLYKDSYDIYFIQNLFSNDDDFKVYIKSAINSIESYKSFKNITYYILKAKLDNIDDIKVELENKMYQKNWLLTEQHIPFFLIKVLINQDHFNEYIKELRMNYQKLSSTVYFFNELYNKKIEDISSIDIKEEYPLLYDIIGSIEGFIAEYNKLKNNHNYREFNKINNKIYDAVICAVQHFVNLFSNTNTNLENLESAVDLFLSSYQSEKNIDQLLTLVLPLSKSSINDKIIKYISNCIFLIGKSKYISVKKFILDNHIIDVWINKSDDIDALIYNIDCLHDLITADTFNNFHKKIISAKQLSMDNINRLFSSEFYQNYYDELYLSIFEKNYFLNDSISTIANHKIITRIKQDTNIVDNLSKLSTTNLLQLKNLINNLTTCNLHNSNNSSSIELVITNLIAVFISQEFTFEFVRPLYIDILFMYFPQNTQVSVNFKKGVFNVLLKFKLYNNKGECLYNKKLIDFIKLQDGFNDMIANLNTDDNTITSNELSLLCSNLKFIYGDIPDNMKDKFERLINKTESDINTITAESNIEKFIKENENLIGSSDKIKNFSKEKLKTASDKDSVKVCLNYKELLGITDEELEDIVGPYIKGLNLWGVQSFIIKYQTSIDSSNKIKNLLKEKLKTASDKDSVKVCLNYKELLGFTDEELEDIVGPYIKALDLWHVESFVITYQTSIGSSNKIKNLLKDKLTEMKDSYAVDICLNYKELLGFTDEELEDIVEAYITGLEPQNVQYFINQDQVKTSIGSSNKIKNLLKEKLSKESDEDSVNVCLKYKALLGITDDELQSLILKTKYLPLNLNYNYLKKIQEGSKDYINILFTECTKNDLEFVIKLHYGYKLQYNESTQDKLSDSTKVLLGLIKKRLSSCGTEELKHFMYNLSIILNKNVLICNLKPELREAIIKNPIWKDALSLEKGIYWILNNIYTKDELIEYIKTVSVSKNNSDLNQYIYKIYNPGAHYRDIPLEISDLLVDFNLECAEGSAALYNHNPSDLPIKKIILSSLNYFSAAKNIKNVINNMTTADENKKPYILLCDALVASKTIGILSICIGIVYFGIKLLSNDTVENAKMDLKDNGFIVIDEVVKIDLISD